MRFRYVLFFLAMLTACARSPLKTPDQAMRKLERLPESLQDDLGFQSLAPALEKNIKFLREKMPTEGVFYFGPRQVSRTEYLRALEFLLSQAKADATGEAFRQALRGRFDAYEVYGNEEWGQVMVTSYFEPVIEGSRKREGRFTQPIYGMPKDLVVVDLNSFALLRPELMPARPLEQRSIQNVLRGRLLASEKDQPWKVVAYPSRAEIDGAKVDAAVLAWADPIDAFFLAIQGSGVVRLKNGRELIVGYAGQNGHPYVAIGKHLKDIIPLEKITMQTIEAHLRSLPLADAKKIMDLNPSYIFFQPLKTSGLTFLGTEVVSGRTIATDQGLFPKGALAFLEFEKPIFASSDATEPNVWQPSSRFVLDQDTGGAIRGPARVDLFWGRGNEAKQAAGVMKNKGRLIYFVPREGF